MKTRIANRLLVRIGLVLALSLLTIASTGHAATHVDQVLPNHDREVAFGYPRTLSGNRGIVDFEPPSSWARNGQLAVTARCLLYPGNSITAIEVIWDVR